MEEKMFKKMLFVFVLAAAVLAFAGYGVPTASACSGSIDDCRPQLTSDAQGFVANSPMITSAPAPFLTTVDGVQYLKPYTTAQDHENTDFAGDD
jgi:hypothetical protein